MVAIEDISTGKTIESLIDINEKDLVMNDRDAFYEKLQAAFISNFPFRSQIEAT